VAGEKQALTQEMLPLTLVGKEQVTFVARKTLIRGKHGGGAEADRIPAPVRCAI
jgi:hypothetical protein